MLIASTICMFFAAPIVLPVVPLLAYLLWGFAGFYSLSVFVVIINTYS